MVLSRSENICSDTLPIMTAIFPVDFGSTTDQDCGCGCKGAMSTEQRITFENGSSDIFAFGSQLFRDYSAQGNLNLIDKHMDFLMGFPEFMPQLNFFLKNPSLSIMDPTNYHSTERYQEIENAVNCAHSSGQKFSSIIFGKEITNVLYKSYMKLYFILFLCFVVVLLLGYYIYKRAKKSKKYEKEEL